MNHNRPAEFIEGKRLQDLGKIEEGGSLLATGIERMMTSQADWENILSLVYTIVDENEQFRAFQSVANTAFYSDFEHAKSMCGTFAKQHLNDFWFTSFVGADIGKKSLDGTRGSVLDLYANEVLGIQTPSVRDEAISSLLNYPEYYSPEKRKALLEAMTESMQKEIIVLRVNRLDAQLP